MKLREIPYWLRGEKFQNLVQNQIFEITNHPNVIINHNPSIICKNYTQVMVILCGWWEVEYPDCFIKYLIKNKNNSILILKVIKQSSFSSFMNSQIEIMLKELYDIPDLELTSKIENDQISYTLTINSLKIFFIKGDNIIFQNLFILNTPHANLFYEILDEIVENVK